MNHLVKEVLDAYGQRLRSNNRQTHPVVQAKKAVLQRSTETGRKALLAGYVCTAVKLFSAGRVREARRFYDGAFEFGDKQQVRSVLLVACIKSARKSLKADKHDAVWLLLATARAYGSLPPNEVEELFVKRGIHRLLDDPSTACTEALKKLHFNFTPAPAAATAAVAA